MSNNIVEFKNDNIHAGVRVLSVNGNTWFVAKDVCWVLGIQNTSQAISSLDEDEYATMDDLTSIRANICETYIGSIGGSDNISDSSNGGKSPLMISESGMYHLTFKSIKPEARLFRRWVTEEVLPSIRKTGGYMVGSTGAELVQRFADMSSELAVTKLKLEEAEAEIAKLNEKPWGVHDRVINRDHYLTAFDVFKKAGYYMRDENEDGDSIIHLCNRLYIMSVKDGYPMTIRKKEVAFHKDVVEHFLTELKTRATPRDLDLGFMPGSCKAAGIKAGFLTKKQNELAENRRLYLEDKDWMLH